MEPPQSDQLSGRNANSSQLESIKYVNTENHSDAFKSLHAMRINQQLCDVTLEVNGHAIRAHKVVLAATTPYFWAMFNGKRVDQNSRA